jgi:hypothetical protein|tara:strand:+ start:525 stop:668 length:144 start_codon:yes stop_codon:yes gene_type:complete
MKFFLLILVLVTHVGCSFAITAAGSFIGNLGAKIAHEEMKDKEKPDE